MTTRHAAYLVILDESVREDSDEDIVNALGMVKHVTAVEPVPHTIDTAIAEQRARDGLGQRILEAVMAEVYPIQETRRG